MASPSSKQADLTKLIETLSVNDAGSSAQQALSSLMGIEVPLDAGVEGAAGFIAQRGVRTSDYIVRVPITQKTRVKGLKESGELV